MDTLTMAVAAALPAEALDCRLFENPSAKPAPLTHDADLFVLFQRAIVDGDESCRRALERQLRGQVSAWCGRPGVAGDPAKLAERTWEKFWLGFTPRRLAGAADAAAIVRYLQVCAHSAVVDAARARQTLRAAVACVPPPGGVAVAVPHPRADPVAGRELERRVQAQLCSEQERVLVRLAYELGLPPAEIAALHPELFPTVRDVFRALRVVLDRLHANGALEASPAVRLS